MWPGGVDSLESISGLLLILKIRAQSTAPLHPSRTSIFYQDEDIWGTFIQRITFSQDKHTVVSICRNAVLEMGKSLPFKDLVRNTELEFLKSQWGLGTEEEYGYRTGPPGFIGWRSSFLGLNSGAP